MREMKREFAVNFTS